MNWRIRQPEDVRPGMRLGRHINHDPRSRAFAIKPRSYAGKTTTRRRVIQVLDQGDFGSCTGNAELGALGCEGLYETTRQVMVANGWKWDQSTARDRLYALATAVDDYAGTFPPTDTGSDGLSVNKASVQLGLSGGYLHALTVDAMITGLQDNAGIAGINWYDSFDDPGPDAVLPLPATAKVRGGHEINVLNVDMERERFQCVNSWGTGWGIAGHFFIPFKVMERLLAEDGDATFPTPLGVAPSPSLPSYSAVDLELKAALDSWGASIVSRFGKAGRLNSARKRWESAHAVS